MTEKVDKNVLLAFRDRPPKTREELELYLRKYYEVFLPSVIIEEGNSTPLDFVWEVYSTFMGYSKNPYYNILGMACRGGMKSLSCGVIEMLALQFDQYRNWIHMAAIYPQAYVTYGYVQKIMRKPLMQGIIAKSTQEETIAAKSGMTLKICTASMESVNSKHGSLVQDELDLTDYAVFTESKGMLSAEQGRMPLNIAISSRKYGMGNVQMLLDKIETDPNYPMKVHRWGILETTSKCLPSRHGRYGTTIYVNEDDLIAITKEEYNFLPKDAPERSKYEKIRGYENCIKCGIFSFCKGRLPKQDASNPFLQPIEQTYSLFKTDDTEFFKSQRLNRKPSKKGLVYPMWEESIHVKTYAQMWEIFHGVAHQDCVVQPGENNPRRKDITRGELLKSFIDHNCSLYVGVDFGFSVMAVAGLYVVDGQGRVYFISELTFTGQSEAEIALKLKEEWGHLPISMVYADPESPSGKKQIRVTTNWAVSENVDKSVEDGVGTVRRFLRIPGTKRAHMFVSRECTVFREEVKTYHYKIDPKTNEPLEVIEKKNDHSMDQCRYFLHTFFGTSAPWNLDFLVKGIKPLGEFNIHSPTRAPTALEMANKLGISFNDNRHEYDENLKKIENTNLSEGSNFNWSF